MFHVDIVDLLLRKHRKELIVLDKTRKLDKVASEQSMKLVWLTPELASEWLNKGKNFRSLKPWYARKLANIIKERGWKQSGDPFRFNTKGQLIDGQHRCAAIEMLDITVQVWVVTNVIDELGIDGGLKRSFVDWLRSQKVANSTHVSCAVTTFCRLFRRDSWRHGQEMSPNIHELVAVFKAHPGLSASVTYCQRVKQYISIGHAAVVHYQCSQENRKVTEAFMDSLSSGEGLSRNDPVHRLRERMIRNKIARHKMNTNDRMRLFIKAWNYHVCGLEARRLSLDPGSPSDQLHVITPKEVKKFEGDMDAILDAAAK